MDSATRISFSKFHCPNQRSPNQITVQSSSTNRQEQPSAGGCVPLLLLALPRWNLAAPVATGTDLSIRTPTAPRHTGHLTTAAPLDSSASDLLRNDKLRSGPRNQSMPLFAS